MLFNHSDYITYFTTSCKKCFNHLRATLTYNSTVSQVYFRLLLLITEQKYEVYYAVSAQLVPPSGITKNKLYTILANFC